MSADYWSAAEVTKEIFETKVCLAKSHSSDLCDGRIVAAHTIPRSQLRQIASDGHVHAIGASAADLARNDGELTAKKIGIGTFSVLNSFCAFHDNKVFAHVEDDLLAFDPHQLTLLHYRTLASELYRKVASYHSMIHQIEEEAKKKKNKSKRSVIDFLRATAIGAQLGIRDAGVEFVRCSEDLFSEKYDRVSALVVHFTRMPTIMTAGAFFPTYDYSGAPIQIIMDYETTPQTLSFNILAADNHAVLVMVWWKDHDVIKKFAESFISQNSEQYTALAIQTAFEYLENTCMQPTWWEGARPVIRKLLLNRMQTGGSPFHKRRADCLAFCGVSFDQWGYDRHEFINV